MGQRTVGRGCGELPSRVWPVVLMTVVCLGAPSMAAPTLSELIVLPPGDTVQIRVGDARRFSVTITDPDVEYRWSLDGTVVSKERRWEYRPEGTDIGTHRVDVTVLLGPAASRRSWQVVVEPPPMPKIIEAEPPGSLVRVPVGDRITFRYRLESSVPSDRVDVRWMVDSEPAGVGTVLELTGEEGPPRRVRAIASSVLGVVQAREWRLVNAAEEPTAAVPTPEAVPRDEELAALVRELPEEKPVRPPTTVAPRRSSTTVATSRRATTSTVAPPVTRTPTVATVSTTIVPAKPPVRVVARTPTSSTVPTVERTRTAAVAPPPTTPPPTTPPSTTPPPTTPIPSKPVIERKDVEELLERYARAYEHRDVDELRRIGQVRTDEQAQALDRYFDRVQYIDVEIHVIEVGTSEPPSVRFRRRDRFRDPSGRLIDEESPVILKMLERTRDGITFAPRS